MNATNQRICAWCGPVCAILWVIGFWVFARFIPPPSPQDTAQEIAHRFATDTDMIRAGLVLLMFGGALYAPWSAVITVQLKRIEGRYSPMAYTQLALGAVFVLVFVVPVFIWQTAAFRPGGDPEIIQRLNDFAWLLFLGPVATIWVQGVAISRAIFADRSERPVFPRWLGYFNLWAITIYLPGALIVFFKHGPFAWNGLFAWWIPLGMFTVWLILLSVMLLRAISEQEREHADPGYVPAV
jgi:hypothetical protein